MAGTLKDLDEALVRARNALSFFLGESSVVDFRTIEHLYDTASGKFEVVVLVKDGTEFVYRASVTGCNRNNKTLTVLATDGETVLGVSAGSVLSVRLVSRG